MFTTQQFFISFLSIVALASISLSTALCIDSPLYAILEDGERERSCRWIIKNRNNYTDEDDVEVEDMCDDAYVASHCPLSCDKCQDYRCADSEAYFVHRGRERSCEWLRDLEDSGRFGWLCSMGRIRRTCRETCGICGGLGNYSDSGSENIGHHNINFIEVEIFDYIDYSNEYIVTDHTAAFRGEPFEDFMGFDAITISTSNAGGNRYDDKPAIFACPQGTFDMYSMYLAPLFGDGGGNVTTVEISAFNEEFEIVGDIAIDLVDVDDVEATRVSLPASFQNLRAVIVWGGFGKYYGFNNIEIYIHSECRTYYSDDTSSDAMREILRKYTSEESERDGEMSNMWEHLGTMDDDVALPERV